MPKTTSNNYSSVGQTTSCRAMADQVRAYQRRDVGHGRRDRDDGRGTLSSSTVTPASLTRLCVQVLTQDFTGLPRGLPLALVPTVTAALPTSLCVTRTAPTVSDERYWKRRWVETTTTRLDVDVDVDVLRDHGLSWKQLVCEHVVAAALEESSPDDESTLADVLTAAGPFVFHLTLTTVARSVDLGQVWPALPNVTRLDVTYGLGPKRTSDRHRNVVHGQNRWLDRSDRRLLGMKISDARALGAVLSSPSSTSLTTLVLPSNVLDDDLARILVSGLLTNTSVTYLDVSHNALSNHGARVLAKLLHPASVLSTLDVGDNHIHAEGGRYLGRALRHNTSLTCLNLRLNRLEDEGGRVLLDALADAMDDDHCDDHCDDHSDDHRRHCDDPPSHHLSELNLSANALTVQSAASLARVLAMPNSGLVHLDLTANGFRESDVASIARALETNSVVTGLDLRQNSDLASDSESLVHVATILRRNERAWRKHHTS